MVGEGRVGLCWKREMGTPFFRCREVKDVMIFSTRQRESCIPTYYTRTDTTTREHEPADDEQFTFSTRAHTHAQFETEGFSGGQHALTKRRARVR